MLIRRTITFCKIHEFIYIFIHIIDIHIIDIFIHLPFSVRSIDHFVASLVFMKNNSCCILR